MYIPDGDPDDDSIDWQYFTETGGFDIEDGVFVLGTDRERLGAFEIKANKTTNLIMLQELRKGSGMTQQELAEKCGMTKTYISRIETL